jgi:DNA modification methylase
VSDWTLHTGDCLNVLPTLPGEAFDLVFTDPPYPEIDRPYGRLTEAEWFDLIRAVVPEVRRVLKPKGSAVFVLQPNSERVGRMRTWLWDFMAWVGREWGIVQDAWWWNTGALPVGGCGRRIGLLRASVKACVWAGAADCYRDQGAVLWEEADSSRAMRTTGRLLRRAKQRYSDRPGVGHLDNEARMAAAALERGGTTPYNLIPLPGGSSANRAHHAGGTPLKLCSWWLRYLCPPGGAVLDPFAGSGTTGVAALKQGKTFVGIEKEPAYVEIARKRLVETQGPLFAQAGG